MMALLKRNARPIIIVVLAAGVVIAGFELIDALTGSGPPGEEAEGDDAAGVASVAGLIKVLLFLAVGAAITVPLRRRLRSNVAK